MTSHQDTDRARKVLIRALQAAYPHANVPRGPYERTADKLIADAAGNPTANILNQLVNFGWEYVYHCHILSHEEMDMMRPVSVAMPPNAPSGLSAAVVWGVGGPVITFTWTDNSINETSFTLQRSVEPGVWVDVATSASPLNVANTHGTRTVTDPSFQYHMKYQYRVVAVNTLGYGGEFMSMTVQSLPSNVVLVAPVGLQYLPLGLRNQ